METTTVVAIDATQFNDLIYNIQTLNTTIETMHENIAAGIQFLMYVGAGIALYFVIKFAWWLFAKLFFGGV